MELKVPLLTVYRSELVVKDLQKLVKNYRLKPTARNRQAYIGCLLEFGNKETEWDM